MTGSAFYWAVVAGLTLLFAVIDVDALRDRRELTRAHSAAIVGYLVSWVVTLCVLFPTGSAGTTRWILPAAIRIAVAALFAGGRLLAGVVRIEERHRRPRLRPARSVPTYRLTSEEVRAAEEYDARWHAEERAHHPHEAPTHEQPREWFEGVVQDAIDAVDPELRARMSNVAIVVEDEPPYGEPYLGFYRGVPLTRRSQGYAGVAPDKISIYRGPLERHYGDDRERLAAEIRRVVWHEIAHHFGVSDQRLVEIDRY